MPSQNITYEKGLPAAVEVEKLVLGSVLINDATFIQAGGLLRPEDFSIEKHQRIFTAMRELYERGERIDRITLANELNRKGLLTDVGGLSYLVSLDDELPVVFNIDSYVRIVRESRCCGESSVRRRRSSTVA